MPHRKFDITKTPQTSAPPEEFNHRVFRGIASSDEDYRIVQSLCTKLEDLGLDKNEQIILIRRLLVKEELVTEIWVKLDDDLDLAQLILDQDD